LSNGTPSILNGVLRWTRRRPISATVTNTNNLLDLTRSELERLAVECGRARFRGRQIYHGIYARRERDFAAFSDLDARFRERLAEHYAIRYPTVGRDCGALAFL